MEILFMMKIWASNVSLFDLFAFNPNKCTYQPSHFYSNNKNIFGRFYPHNKSYLGKSLSKHGTILLFWTKLYPKDNLNHDKNNKIQLLHIVLWTDGNNIYPPSSGNPSHVFTDCVSPWKIHHPPPFKHFSTLWHPPLAVDLSLFWSRIEIFWFISHGASGWWTVKLYPRPTLRLATSRPHVSILVRLCSQLLVYFSRLPPQRPGSLTLLTRYLGEWKWINQQNTQLLNLD